MTWDSLQVLDRRRDYLNRPIGLATVAADPSGFVIRDRPVHVTANGSRWVRPPSVPQLSSNGTVRRDARGKILYTRILDWPEVRAERRLSNQLVAQIDVHSPEAFSQGGRL